MEVLEGEKMHLFQKKKEIKGGKRIELFTHYKGKRGWRGK
jgi:hypothetical protein